MKRPPHSFVVEVRRQRRPPGEPAKPWFEEPPPTEATPASLAAFASPVRALSERAPSRPPGRILQSLVEPPPAADLGEPPALKPRKAKTAAAKKLPAYKKQLAKRRELRRAEAPARDPAPPPPPAPVQSAAPAASDSRQPSRAERHARILKRYVYAGEPKAGERWKRRLQRGER